MTQRSYPRTFTRLGILGLSLGAGLAVLVVFALEADEARILQVAKERYGESGNRRATSWLRLIEEIRDQPAAEQLDRVNRFFNIATEFSTDQAIWGQADYWATPLEMLGVGRGDCEDFAIAKYVTLRLAGMSDENLRLIYVRARTSVNTFQAHMVLGYYADASATPLILDNLIGTVEIATNRTDLTPVYGFNGEGLWLGSQRSASAANPLARLSRWRDVIQRMQSEGIRP